MADFDYNAAAHTLISHLEEASRTNEAKIVKSAIEDGATGTEILMALRFHIANIVRSASLEESTMALAMKLLSELDKALA